MLLLLLLLHLLLLAVPFAVAIAIAIAFISFCRAASYSILYTEHTNTRTFFRISFHTRLLTFFLPSLSLSLSGCRGERDRCWHCSLTLLMLLRLLLSPLLWEYLRCCCFYCNLCRVVVFCLLLLPPFRWLVVFKNASILTTTRSAATHLHTKTGSTPTTHTRARTHTITLARHVNERSSSST